MPRPQAEGMHALISNICQPFNVLWILLSSRNPTAKDDMHLLRSIVQRAFGALSCLLHALRSPLSHASALVGQIVKDCPWLLCSCLSCLLTLLEHRCTHQKADFECFSS